MKKIRALFIWILSVLSIPFVAAYKAIKAGIVHIFNEVDRLFNFTKKEVFMTIADDIAAIKAAVLTPAPVTVDLTPVETAVAAVKADTTAILADLTPTPAPAA